MHRACKKGINRGDEVKIFVTINGGQRNIDIEADEMLLDMLRKIGLVSVKRACDTGSCGVCTVLLDGYPIPSCSYYAAKAEGHNITTIEGVQKEAIEIAEFLVSEGVEQCGYCSPGFALTILGMTKELQNPTEDDIKHYLVGNLCRCSGYVGHLRAINKYLEVKR